MKVEIELNEQMLKDLRQYRRAKSRLLEEGISQLDKDMRQTEFDLACIVASFNLDFALQEAGFDNPYHVRDAKVIG